MSYKVVAGLRYEFTNGRGIKLTVIPSKTVRARSGATLVLGVVAKGNEIITAGSNARWFISRFGTPLTNDIARLV